MKKLKRMVEIYNVYAADLMTVERNHRIFVLYIDETEITRGDLQHIEKRVHQILKELGLLYELKGV